MTGRLAGKIAVITGTGGGQGRAAALSFALEGATIAGCDLKSAGAEETVEMVRTAGGVMTSTHPIDLADREAVAGWISAVVAEHGGIDILYNNASAPRFAPITQMSVDDWRFTLRNELDVVFHVTALAWPHLIARGGGSVVNIASMQGISAIRSVPGGFAHAATKHGVIGLTRELANEGGPHGIRVNAISPGLIMSPATSAMADIPGVLQSFVDRQIIKRLGQPEDIVHAALFLASDEASFITGANLVVDGGYTVV
jgi:NAD(P)-dependent dehydrogenase (short-subunit alcohol dehydrogenase family)